ncbi:MAG: CDP-alcohol phosphatidyltransferase family protein [Candidatus Ancillula sp.]|nr:CDP-alcohol phosphatidyltransferase family protein [Candidatus Ancillula sp.]
MDSVKEGVMFIGKYNRTVIITYVGVSAGVVGSFLATVSHLPKYALICLVIAGICDLFDGAFARGCKRTKEEEAFGVQIDSLSDMINFIMLPICIFYSLGLTYWYHVIFYVAFALTAVIRLAYFNVVVNANDNQVVKHYQGIPVTSTAIIVPILWILAQFLTLNASLVLFTIAIAIIPLLFILNIKIPKLKGLPFYITMSVLALICTIILLLVGV